MSLEHLKEIIEIQLANLRKRLLDRKPSINLTDNSKELLAKEGNPENDPGSAGPKLFSGEFGEGDTIVVDAEKGEMAFRKEG